MTPNKLSPAGDGGPPDDTIPRVVGQRRPCFSNKPHPWSEPIRSPLYGCVVQVCSICGAVSPVREVKR